MTLHPDYDDANWSLVPAHLQEGLREYVEHGRQVGSFLTAVLSNDLTNAVIRADDVSLAGIRGLVVWLYNYAPGDCHGSERRFREWIAIGGLSGKAKTEASARLSAAVASAEIDRQCDDQPSPVTIGGIH